MDYRGVLDTCEDIVSHVTERHEHATEIARLLPLEHRIALIFSALARVELNDLVVARQYLATADLAMRQQPVHLDWYWRLPLEWGMASLLLSSDTSACAMHAERFADLAQATDERMWQAIAFETLARLALAREEPRTALAWIDRAQEATRGFETPHADWRAHRTAAQAHEALGDAGQSAARRAQSQEVRRKLAQSLPEHHPFRRRIQATTAVL